MIQALVRPLENDDLPAVRTIMDASRMVDAIPGFVASEVDRALLRISADPGGTLLAIDDGSVVGYCTPLRDDLTIHPHHRRRGHGRRLVAAARSLVARRGEDELVLYVPPHLPASGAFATSLGFRYRSSLWQFELPAEVRVPAASFPGDVVTRTWNGDEDLDAWVRFVSASFEGHPTPIHLSPEVVRRINAEPSFDPEGIKIVATCEAPDDPIAFGRVELLREPDAEPIGYVNLIGVLPAWRGRGLGRELLRWSVGHLRERGARTIQLSVEAANARATELYRRHGFVPDIEWPHWSLPAS
ncbi:MAG TPA: GNAT family N-acetyltransferase [Candidatus Limnocylindrales bacterium]|jgi:mycothiol synthase